MCDILTTIDARASVAVHRFIVLMGQLLALPSAPSGFTRKISKAKFFPLFRLPTKLLVQVLSYLDEPNLRRLGLTCYYLFDISEATRCLVPKIYVLEIKSTHQHKLAHRILSEALPETSVLRRADRTIIGQRSLFQRATLPCDLPDYYHLRRSSLRVAFRTVRGLYNSPDKCWPQVWLCPHWGITSKELSHLRLDSSFPTRTVRDTVQALCPFPKCSLWVRHAIVTTRTPDVTYELCSTIRIYRQWCSSPEPLHIRNSMVTHLGGFRMAMQALQMCVCSHLKLSDRFMVDSYAPELVVCLPASATHVDVSTAFQLQTTFDEHQCERCKDLGTYTTWGFIARSIPVDGGCWIDTELLLCRPISDLTSKDIRTDRHWMHHTIQHNEMTKYVGHWWTWASKVAESGFDWRAPLPVGHFRQCRKDLFNFCTRKKGTQSAKDPDIANTVEQSWLYTALAGKEWLETSLIFSKIHIGKHGAWKLAEPGKEYFSYSS